MGLISRSSIETIEVKWFVISMPLRGTAGQWGRLHDLGEKASLGDLPTHSRRVLSCHRFPFSAEKQKGETLFNSKTP